MGLLSVAAAGLAWRAIRLKHRLEWSERDRRRAADELNRRLSELFSLQELSYILSGPLQLERIVEQVGTLVIADPRDGAFPPEDVRLLSTVATHAAIVIANARFFEHVRHAKEQWETAFDSLSEGIAVVDEAGRVRRANRSLATMLGVPIPGVIGCDLGEALLGPPSEIGRAAGGGR